MFTMSQEEKFNFDIENLKQDFAIENMFLTDQDINLLKRFSNNEITQHELINIIKYNSL